MAGIDFGGLRGAGSMIAERSYKVLDDLMAKREKREEEEKGRAREFDALMSYGEARGYFSKDQAKPMGLEQLKGLVRAKEGESMEEERREKLKLVAAQLAEYGRRQEADEGLTGFARSYGEGPRKEALGDQVGRLLDPGMKGWGQGLPKVDPRLVAEDARPRTTEERMFEALKRYPAAARDDRFGQVLRGLEGYGGGGKEGLDHRPASASFGGRDVIYSPKTGQFQLMPERAGGVEFKKSPGGSEYVVDPKGNLKFSPRAGAAGKGTMADMALQSAESHLVTVAGELSAARGKLAREGRGWLGRNEKLVAELEVKVKDLMMNLEEMRRVRDGDEGSGGGRAAPGAGGGLLGEFEEWSKRQ